MSLFFAELQEAQKHVRYGEAQQRSECVFLGERRTEARGGRDEVGKREQREGGERVHMFLQSSPVLA